MPIVKRCSRCNKRIPSGSKCDCKQKRYKEYDKDKKTSKESQFYKTAEWLAAREKAIYNCGGMDLYSLYVLKRIEYGQTVHHIEPLEERWELRVDGGNLIYLTESNHRVLHNAMKESPQRKAEIQALLKSILDQHMATIG